MSIVNASMTRVKGITSRFLKLSVCLVCIAAFTTSCYSTATVKASDRPNIIFILVDDLGWGDVGYLGSEIKTPNIDSLAATGVTLDHAYAFPICSPTRAALMTGKNPLRFGIDGPMENDAMLPGQLTLLPEHLRHAGYETWMVGKWHLGMSQSVAMPHARGFDHFYGSLGGFIDFYTHVYFGGLDWQRNGKSVREKGYATHLLTRETVKLLSEYDGKKPFFLYLSYNSPHTPLQYPPAAKDDYASIKAPDRRVFAQMTTDLDAAIGEVMESLRQQNLLENTIVVFMSDNGGNLEAGAYNGKLREGKGSVLEGGVRVPAFIAWPNELQGKRSVQRPVFVQDWLPTLLDAADIDFSEKEFDGRSVWQMLTKNAAIQPVEPVVIGVARSKAVYQWPWKLVHNQARDGSPARDQLFNIETDPIEANNVASEHAGLVKQLRAGLDALPVGTSKAAKGPPPESLFRDATGAFDYDIRKPETREPWAEAANSPGLSSPEAVEP